MIMSDKVYEQIREFCSGHPEIKKVTLFGSRARGDFHDKSDYDLALVMNPQIRFNWQKLVIELEEALDTLKKVDIVNYQEISDEFRSNIDKEGVKLYEREN